MLFLSLCVCALDEFDSVVGLDEQLGSDKKARPVGPVQRGTTWNE